MLILNRIKDMVQSHIYDIQSGVNTTMARHYKIIGILKIPQSLFRDSREIGLDS